MAKDRRRHSSIDKLPDELRNTLTLMVVDNEWPKDWPYGPTAGKPRYEDVAMYAASKGHSVSTSAVGRWAKPLQVQARMKQASLIARQTMAGLDDNASEQQKAAVEMISAITIELLTSRMADDKELDPKEIHFISRAMKDCTTVAINSDKYIREQINTKAKEADKTITDIAKSKQIDPETLKIIREQIYGIIK